MYESSTKTSKKSIDTNAAMLAAFEINKTEQPKRVHPSYNNELSYLARKGMPVVMDESHPAISGSVYFKWLL